MYPFAVRSILLTHLHFLTWEITLRAIPWLCLLIVVDYGSYGFIARKKRVSAMAGIEPAGATQVCKLSPQPPWKLQ